MLKKFSISIIKEVFKRKGYTFFDSLKKYNVNIIGIRNDNNVANTFDDYMCIIYRDEHFQEQIHIYPCTTDAGTYWLQNPSSSSKIKGTAILVPNQYKGCYQLGLHKGKYKALVQRGRVCVWRDDNRDNILDFNNSKAEWGLFGINIHRSNPHTESSEVNKWSAGCQVFKNVKNYNAFINIIEMSSALYGNKFTYTILTKNDFLNVN